MIARVSRHHTTLGFALVATLLAVTACGSYSEGGQPTTSAASSVEATTSAPSAETFTTAAPTATGEDCAPTEPAVPASSEQPPLTELLQFVPDEPEYRQRVEFRNNTAFDRDRTLTRPHTDCTEQVSLYGESRFASNYYVGELGLIFGGPSELAISQQEAWGFSYLDASFDLDTGSQSYPLRIRSVDVPATDITDAVNADSEWSTELATVAVGDNEFFQWGQGFMSDSDRKTGARPNGQGATLAVVDGITIQAAKPDQTTASLTAAQNGTGLDSNEAFANVAAQLEHYQVHIGSISDGLPRSASVSLPLTSDTNPDELQKFVDSFPRLVDYQALGLGWDSTSERGPGTVTLVFATDSPQATIDAIVQRLALDMPDLIHPAAPKLSLQESSVDGNVAILRFDSPDTVNLQDLSGDLLLSIIE